MLTEKQKMLNGNLYNAADTELVNERRRTRLLLKQLNGSSDDEQSLRQQMLKELIPDQGLDLWVESPFYCDYGSNITVACKRTRPNQYRQIRYFEKLKIFYQYGYNRQF